MTSTATESRRAPTGAVASEQRLCVSRPAVPASAEGARALGRVYWQEVERFTRGIVRPRAHGNGLDLVLLRHAVLLRLGPPELRVRGEAVVCRHAILGGLLARSPGGSISFAQYGGAEPELRSTIAGFRPRLAARPGRPGWTGTLYAQGQARLHRAVGRRYFARLAGEAA